MTTSSPKFTRMSFQSIGKTGKITKGATRDKSCLWHPGKYAFRRTFENLRSVYSLHKEFNPLMERIYEACTESSSCKKWRCVTTDECRTHEGQGVVLCHEFPPTRFCCITGHLNIDLRVFWSPRKPNTGSKNPCLGFRGIVTRKPTHDGKIGFREKMRPRKFIPSFPRKNGSMQIENHTRILITNRNKRRNNPKAKVLP